MTLKLVATIFESSCISEVLDNEACVEEFEEHLKSIVIYETRPNMAYVVVNHSIQGVTELGSFGIPFIVSIPPSSPVSIDGLKTAVLKLLMLARIVKNGSDAHTFQAAMGGGLHPTANFVLEEGQICTMDLIWDSVETKDAFYDQEEDIKVRSSF